MVSTVKEVTPIYPHETWVITEMDGDERISLRIETDRSNVKNYADNLVRVDTDDINELRDPHIMTEVEGGVLTPTCLVHGGVQRLLDGGGYDPQAPGSEGTLCGHPFRGLIREKIYGLCGA